MIVTIENQRDKTQKVIECINIETNNRVWEFYGVFKNNKVIECAYCLYNWDIVKIEYETL